jgi:transcriptional antiterminator RfaH
MNETRKRNQPAERWYAVQTIARRESGAEIQLEAQGFRVFLPRELKSVRHARKFRTVHAPLFPGYLFVSLDLQRDRWRSINGTRGVACLVMAENAPAPVPCGVVEALISCIDDKGLCRRDRALVEGQNVRVTFGPLAQAVGLLIGLDAKDRVRVLLEILGGRVVTTIERCALEVA